MSSAGDKPSAGRVLVALDALSQGRAAIDAAVALAAGLRAELRGLFVKNADLLSLAALPFAAEIGFSSPPVRQLDRDSLERTLQAQAEQLGRILAEAAEQAQLQCSFEVSRGRILQAALAAATECNLLIVGLEGRAPKPVRGWLATAPKRAASPALFAFDGKPSARSALETAGRVAAEDGDGLVVLAAAPDIARARVLRAQAQDLLRETRVKATLGDAFVTDAASLVEAATTLHGKALVVNRDSFLLADATLPILVNELTCPLVVVR